MEVITLLRELAMAWDKDIDNITKWIGKFK